MNDITIIMPCFNKEKYISKALESIFEQKTKYQMEILIADDFSTDKTLEIINNYKSKTNIPFKILTFKENKGLYHNIIRAYKELKTPYFTVLDPDDYWCDENRIENALNFLEANKDFTIYSYNLLVKNSKNTYPYFNIKNSFNFDFDDYINGKASVSQTSGTVFRNVVFSKGLPSQLYTLKDITKISSFRGDSFRNMIHLHEGKCHFDPKCCSVYQITNDGIWTATSNIKRDLLNINLFHDMYLYFNKENIELLQKSFNLYKIFLKKLPSLLMTNKQTQEEIKQIYENLAELQTTYSNYSNELKLKYTNKNPIKNFIIQKVNKLYYRFIKYMD